MHDGADERRGTVPDQNTVGLVTRARFRLIRWLAHGDAVLMNTTMVVPTGWELHKNQLDSKGLLVNNLLMAPGAQTIPHTRVMWADWRNDG